MRKEEYGKLISQARAKPRQVIEMTIRLLGGRAPLLIERLGSTLDRGPIPKPVGFEQDPHTDYYLVNLSASEAVNLVELLRETEVSAIMDDSPDAGETARIVDQWNALIVEK